jgi:transposase-like protein
MELNEAVRRTCAKTNGPAPRNPKLRKRVVTLYFRGLGTRVIADRLGINSGTVYRIVEKSGILRSREDAYRLRDKRAQPPLRKWLTKNSKVSRGGLKKRLTASGLLKNECAICGLVPVWNGKVLVLVLDHENGIRTDNRIRNLRLICPNCDSQTETFKGRNKCSHREKMGLSPGLPR